MTDTNKKPMSHEFAGALLSFRVSHPFTRLIQYPTSSGVAIVGTVLYPGDALFLPRHVVHSVRATSDSFSAHLTFGFRNDNEELATFRSSHRQLAYQFKNCDDNCDANTGCCDDNCDEQNCWWLGPTDTECSCDSGCDCGQAASCDSSCDQVTCDGGTITIGN